MDLYFFTWFPLALIKIEKDAAAAFEYYARILLPPFWFMLGFLLKGVQDCVGAKWTGPNQRQANKHPQKSCWLNFFFQVWFFCHNNKICGAPVATGMCCRNGPIVFIVAGAGKLAAWKEQFEINLGAYPGVNNVPGIIALSGELTYV